MNMGNLLQRFLVARGGVARRLSFLLVLLLACFGVFGDKKNLLFPLKLSFYELSTQYGSGYTPFTFPAQCSNLCVPASSQSSANVILANIYKNKVNTDNQIWVGTFWESPDNYKAISPAYQFDYIASYAMQSSFFINSMVRDTFYLAGPGHKLPIVPYNFRIKNEMMSVWISNCNARKRLKLLHDLTNQGVTYASYGSCNREGHTAKQQYQYPTPWDNFKNDIYNLCKKVNFHLKYDILYDLILMVFICNFKKRMKLLK
mgnify:CR=1 FL=1